MKNRLLAGLAAAFVTAAPALAEPAMWRVSDADSEILLFGSVHVLKPDTEWRTGRLDTALQTSDEVFYELPMTAEAQAAAPALISQYGVNTPDAPLSSWLTDAQNAQLDRLATGLGASGAQMEPLRPWLAMIQLSMGYTMLAGYDPMSGVEQTLAAESEDSRERFFETYDDQFGFFANLPSEVESNLLVVTMDQIDSQPDQLDLMVDAWAAGDVTGLDALFHDGMRELDQEIYEVLIVRRNEHWAEEIAEMMEGSGSALIVVGAGHLVGDQGVPTLLEAQGFTVERVQ